MSEGALHEISEAIGGLRSDTVSIKNDLRDIKGCLDKHITDEEKRLGDIERTLAEARGAGRIIVTLTGIGGGFIGAMLHWLFPSKW